jgi:hypothetical protein
MRGVKDAWRQRKAAESLGSGFLGVYGLCVHPRDWGWCWAGGSKQGLMARLDVLCEQGPLGWGPLDPKR